MKLRLTHIEKKKSVIESSGRGLPTPKIISTYDLSCSLLYVCKPHISSYMY